MAITGNVEFKVETGVLRNKAIEVQRLVNNMRGDFNELAAAVNSTRQFWIGEAGDLHRRLYDQQSGNVDEIIRRLTEHPRDLMIMAGVYDDAENKNTETAVSMRGDVIV